jgi:hypothetical protein
MEHLLIFLEKATRIHFTLMLTAVWLACRLWEHYEDTKYLNPYDLLDGTLAIPAHYAALITGNLAAIAFVIFVGSQLYNRSSR